MTYHTVLLLLLHVDIGSILSQHLDLPEKISSVLQQNDLDQAQEYKDHDRHLHRHYLDEPISGGSAHIKDYFESRYLEELPGASIAL